MLTWKKLVFTGDSGKQESVVSSTYYTLWESRDNPPSWQVESAIVAEKGVSGVEERLVQIKMPFGQFEETHDAYHNLLTENNDIVAIEEWFGNIEASYIDGVQTAKHWLCSLNNSINVKPECHDEPLVDVAKLVALMSVPKLEIDKFSGDPLEYQTFVAIFNETIDSRIDDPQIKLTRLLQYTTGPAKAAIRNCALVGGGNGCTQARDRYGDSHLVSQKVVDDLKKGEPVSKAQELQQLSDDLTMVIRS